SELVDVDKAALRAVMDEWHTITTTDEGTTLADALEQIEKQSGEGGACRNLAAAIKAFCPGAAGKLPEPHKLGNRLCKFRGRNIEGRTFDGRPGRVAKWVLRTLADGNRADLSDLSDLYTSPAGAPARTRGEKEKSGSSVQKSAKSDTSATPTLIPDDPD